MANELNEFLDSMDAPSIDPGSEELPADTDIVQAAPEYPELSEEADDKVDTDTGDVDDTVLEKATDEEDGDGTTIKGDTPDTAQELEKARRDAAVWEQRYKERQSLEDKRWNQYKDELDSLKLKQAEQKQKVVAPDFGDIDPDYLKAAEYFAEEKARRILDEFSTEELPRRVDAWQREQAEKRQSEFKAQSDLYIVEFDALKARGDITEELIPAMTEYYQENFNKAVESRDPIFVWKMIEHARKKTAKPTPSTTKEDKATAMATQTTRRQPKPTDKMEIKSKNDLLDSQ